MLTLRGRHSPVRPEGAAGTRSKGDGQVERRGPDRARNVARLPKAEPKLAPQPNVAKAANGDDNWQEF